MEQYELTERDWLTMFPALDSLTRLNMLIYIRNEGPVPHSKVAKKFGLSTKDYDFNINRLFGVELVENSWSRYYAEEDPAKRNEISSDLDVVVTERGQKVLEKLCD